ncbi:hypothetical protein C5467_04575 [Photorhabdus khanii subsp. guanajuatensis]|uniref:Uncharacterized protein n=1 Tax=Photorhabdus khanii subsp. guanajuatensis TaxID=2100166 RepID=A0A4R4K1L1_9GAMM|nr:hypothetical protein C5467_04575 [Photorhabdus khanii subsp. guanajuatensis]
MYHPQKFGKQKLKKLWGLKGHAFLLSYVSCAKERQIAYNPAITLNGQTSYISCRVGSQFKHSAKAFT